MTDPKPPSRSGATQADLSRRGSQPGSSHENVDKLLFSLRERAKELNCLYRVEELLRDPDAPLETVLRDVMQAIPPGWQYPEHCRAAVTFRGQPIGADSFEPTPWVQQADILVRDVKAGTISVYYTQQKPQADEGPFLKEEARLIRTIAERLGHFILHQELRRTFEGVQDDREGLDRREWRAALNLLRKTDQNLYVSICRKMMNHLCWAGSKEAQSMLARERLDLKQGDDNAPLGQTNRPREKLPVGPEGVNGDDVFHIAPAYLSDEEILSKIQKWVHEDKASFLVQTLSDQQSSFSEIADGLRRYKRLIPEGIDLSKSTMNGLRVSLIRRLVTDQLEFINVAKRYLEIEDFCDLQDRMVCPPGGRGKLGGKSAGLVLARRVLEAERANLPEIGEVRIPKTWYLTSDGVLHFIRYNNLEEVLEQKYKELEQVRQEYPHIIQVFKNSPFPPDLVQGLSMALDDFDERPLIVRSSSLLEDRFGSAFPGKYKSLFLANQGPKRERLDALIDAIAEVYASTFGPDPIEYRSERGLLDFNEQMGVMIQEVVGTRVGWYHFPAFAGVAFSNNEFRWSSRISREDGLVRLVPGLGTRAVDRLSDDYPVLVAPGQPGLRVNVSPDEVVRYSPKKIDLINLRKRRFETLDVQDVLREFGEEYPGLEKLVSVFQDGYVREPVGALMDYEGLVITFEGLVRRTPFVRQINAILKVLQDKLGAPVDIEFASDGMDLYLLQCRPQSFSGKTAPAPIPKDIPENRIIFSAARHVSNGRVPDITHIVYVDPERYNELSDRADLLAVGRVVSKLNKLLPKRQFILMGPGRWGSRGDIKLGVNVTYSDINNTSLLVEVARQKGAFVPDLSFGTHFFQDLVEANIRYLPLYPGDRNVAFNDLFLQRSRSILKELVPEHAGLSDVVRVIDVRAETDGMVLRVLMNGELDEALAFLAPPAEQAVRVERRELEAEEETDHWRWRLRMAEQIAAQMDSAETGVHAMYVFGSTKNATAGPGSDIDLILHFRGTEQQREHLEAWLAGWSLCLGEVNYLRTGYRTPELLDVHIVTDEDIEKKSSFAVKIGAVTDAARPLKMKNGKKAQSTEPRP
jgi:pyruvate, water dikinase